MKKILFQILAFQFCFYAAGAQKANDFKNPHPEALPGYVYGFDWPVIFPKTPPTPPPPPPIYNNDLSVSMEQLGEIKHGKGRPYFTVRFRLTITNTAGADHTTPVEFPLKVSKKYLVPTGVTLDRSVVTPDKFYTVIVGRDQTNVFEDIIQIYYPFSSYRGRKKYLKIPVEVTAEIPLNRFRWNGHSVWVDDPDHNNNKASFTLVTPLPIPYVPADTR